MTDTLMRWLVFLSALAVICAAMHANVLHAGGYQSADAPLIITLAGLLALGVGFVCAVWNSGRKAQAVVLFVCILSGEAYWLLTNADRELQAREAAAAPISQAREARAAAMLRVKTAEAAKQAADDAAITKAAERGCANNCRAILLATQAAANVELEAARGALAAAPKPQTSTALADELGIKPERWNLILAALRSIAVIGGSLAIGLTLHLRPAKVAEIARVIPGSGENPAPVADVATFAAECLFPAPGASVESKRLFPVYCARAAEKGLSALPREPWTASLKALCEHSGLQVQTTPDGFKVLGVKLAA